jgi:large subunit ribosomal protein L18
MRTEKKQRLGQLRHWRIRKKVIGTKDRPRMSVCFTNQNIHVQFIDDLAGVTLAAASTLNKGDAKGKKSSANVISAKAVGTKAADRGTARYHGKVKALADAAREAGLKF